MSRDGVPVALSLGSRHTSHNVSQSSYEDFNPARVYHNSKLSLSCVRKKGLITDKTSSVDVAHPTRRRSRRIRSSGSELPPLLSSSSSSLHHPRPSSRAQSVSRNVVVASSHRVSGSQTPHFANVSHRRKRVGSLRSSPALSRSSSCSPTPNVVTEVQPVAGAASPQPQSYSMRKAGASPRRSVGSSVVHEHGIHGSCSPATSTLPLSHGTIALEPTATLTRPEAETKLLMPWYVIRGIFSCALLVTVRPGLLRRCARARVSLRQSRRRSSSTSLRACASARSLSLSCCTEVNVQDDLVSSDEGSATSNHHFAQRSAGNYGISSNDETCHRVGANSHNRSHGDGRGNEREENENKRSALVPSMCRSSPSRSRDNGGRGSGGRATAHVPRDAFTEPCISSVHADTVSVVATAPLTRMLSLECGGGGNGEVEADLAKQRVFAAERTTRTEMKQGGICAVPTVPASVSLPCSTLSPSLSLRQREGSRRSSSCRKRPSHDSHTSSALPTPAQSARCAKREKSQQQFRQVKQRQKKRRLPGHNHSLHPTHPFRYRQTRTDEVMLGRAANCAVSEKQHMQAEAEQQQHEDSGDHEEAKHAQRKPTHQHRDALCHQITASAVCSIHEAAADLCATQAVLHNLPCAQTLWVALPIRSVNHGSSTVQIRRLDNLNEVLATLSLDTMCAGKDDEGSAVRTSRTRVQRTRSAPSLSAARRTVGAVEETATVTAMLQLRGTWHDTYRGNSNHDDNNNSNDNNDDNSNTNMDTDARCTCDSRRQSPVICAMYTKDNSTCPCHRHEHNTASRSDAVPSKIYLDRSNNSIRADKSNMEDTFTTGGGHSFEENNASSCVAALPMLTTQRRRKNVDEEDEDDPVVMGFSNGSLHVLDAATGRSWMQAATKNAHRGAVTALQRHPRHSGGFISAGSDGALALWCAVKIVPNSAKMNNRRSNKNDTRPLDSTHVNVFACTKYCCHDVDGTHGVLRCIGRLHADSNMAAVVALTAWSGNRPNNDSSNREFHTYDDDEAKTDAAWWDDTSYQVDYALSADAHGVLRVWNLSTCHVQDDPPVPQPPPLSCQRTKHVRDKSMTVTHDVTSLHPVSVAARSFCSTHPGELSITIDSTPPQGKSSNDYNNISNDTQKQQVSSTFASLVWSQNCFQNRGTHATAAAATIVAVVAIEHLWLLALAQEKEEANPLQHRPRHHHHRPPSPIRQHSSTVRVWDWQSEMARSSVWVLPVGISKPTSMNYVAATQRLMVGDDEGALVVLQLAVTRERCRLQTMYWLVPPVGSATNYDCNGDDTTSNNCNDEYNRTHAHVHTMRGRASRRSDSNVYPGRASASTTSASPAHITHVPLSPLENGSGVRETLWVLSHTPVRPTAPDRAVSLSVSTLTRSLGTADADSAHTRISTNLSRHSDPVRMSTTTAAHELSRCRKHSSRATIDDDRNADEEDNKAQQGIHVDCTGNVYPPVHLAYEKDATLTGLAAQLHTQQHTLQQLHTACLHSSPRHKQRLLLSKYSSSINSSSRLGYSSSGGGGVAVVALSCAQSRQYGQCVFDRWRRFALWRRVRLHAAGRSAWVKRGDQAVWQRRCRVAFHAWMWCALRRFHEQRATASARDGATQVDGRAMQWRAVLPRRCNTDRTWRAAQGGTSEVGSHDRDAVASRGTEEDDDAQDQHSHTKERANDEDDADCSIKKHANRIVSSSTSHAHDTCRTIQRRHRQNIAVSLERRLHGVRLARYFVFWWNGVLTRRHHTRCRSAFNRLLLYCSGPAYSNAARSWREVVVRAQRRSEQVRAAAWLQSHDTKYAHRCHLCMTDSLADTVATVSMATTVSHGEEQRVSEWNKSAAAFASSHAAAAAASASVCVVHAVTPSFVAESNARCRKYCFALWQSFVRQRRRTHALSSHRLSSDEADWALISPLSSMWVRTAWLRRRSFVAWWHMAIYVSPAQRRAEELRTLQRDVRVMQAALDDEEEAKYMCYDGEGDNRAADAHKFTLVEHGTVDADARATGLIASSTEDVVGDEHDTLARSLHYNETGSGANADSHPRTTPSVGGEGVARSRICRRSDHRVAEREAEVVALQRARECWDRRACALQDAMARLRACESFYTLLARFAVSPMTQRIQMMREQHGGAAVVGRRCYDAIESPSWQQLHCPMRHRHRLHGLLLEEPGTPSIDADGSKMHASVKEKVKLACSLCPKHTSSDAKSNSSTDHDNDDGGGSCNDSDDKSQRDAVNDVLSCPDVIDECAEDGDVLFLLVAVLRGLQGLALQLDRDEASMLKAYALALRLSLMIPEEKGGCHTSPGSSMTLCGTPRHVLFADGATTVSTPSAPTTPAKRRALREGVHCASTPRMLSTQNVGSNNNCSSNDSPRAQRRVIAHVFDAVVQKIRERLNVAAAEAGVPWSNSAARPPGPPVDTAALVPAPWTTSAASVSCSHECSYTHDHAKDGRCAISLKERPSPAAMSSTYTKKSVASSGKAACGKSCDGGSSHTDVMEAVGNDSRKGNRSLSSSSRLSMQSRAMTSVSLVQQHPCSLSWLSRVPVTVRREVMSAVTVLLVLWGRVEAQTEYNEWGVRESRTSEALSRPCVKQTHQHHQQARRSSEHSTTEAVHDVHTDIQAICDAGTDSYRNPNDGNSVHNNNTNDTPKLLGENDYTPSSRHVTRAMLCSRSSAIFLVRHATVLLELLRPRVWVEQDRWTRALATHAAARQRAARGAEHINDDKAEGRCDTDNTNREQHDDGDGDSGWRYVCMPTHRRSIDRTSERTLNTSSTNMTVAAATTTGPKTPAAAAARRRLCASPLSAHSASLKRCTSVPAAALPAGMWQPATPPSWLTTNDSHDHHPLNKDGGGSRNIRAGTMAVTHTLDGSMNTVHGGESNLCSCSRDSSMRTQPSCTANSQPHESSVGEHRATTMHTAAALVEESAVHTETSCCACEGVALPRTDTAVRAVVPPLLPGSLCSLRECSAALATPQRMSRRDNGNSIYDGSSRTFNPGYGSIKTTISGDDSLVDDGESDELGGGGGGGAVREEDSCGRVTFSVPSLSLVSTPRSLTWRSVTSVPVTRPYLGFRVCVNRTDAGGVVLTGRRLSNTHTGSAGGVIVIKEVAESYTSAGNAVQIAGPAWAAGLRAGDELVRFAGYTVTDLAAFNAIVSRHVRPGARLGVTVRRGVEVVSMVIHVGTRVC